LLYAASRLFDPHALRFSLFSEIYVVRMPVRPRPAAVRSIGRCGEQNQVAVRISNNEGPRTPRLGLEPPEEIGSGRLKLLEQFLDLGARVKREGGRQQLVSLTNIADKDGLAEEVKTEPCSVTHDQPIKRGIAIRELDRKTEFRDIVIPRAAEA
jgi:hypothetical protein